MSQWNTTDMCNLKKDYAQGAIVRMKLENFVTYDSLEFSPGANLNVVIGPNGTGKSSIVCAICLGMAGKPAVLGRAANISDYIKYGRSKASIEIELNNTNGRNYVVRRTMFKDNKSEWCLNERQVKIKDIEELVQSLNIQVNNLCQFLPQEKVSEFARLNTYELLESTEKAVGGYELYERHMELKENAKTSRDLERDVLSIEDELKREVAKNSRLEGQVSSYLEKKKFEESVQWLKRKRACLVYTEKRKEYDTVKKQKNQLTNEVEELRRRFEPLEDKKDKLELKIKRHKQYLSEKTRQIGEAMTTSRNLNTRLNECTEKVNEVKAQYAIKESEIKSRKANLIRLTEELTNAENQYSEAKKGEAEIIEKEQVIKQRDNENRHEQEKLTNAENQYSEAKKGEAEIIEKEQVIKQRDNENRHEQEKLTEKQYEKTQSIVRLKTEKENLQQELAKMRSVREEKLEKLKNGYNHAYRAVQWLENNRDKFEGKVFEPMFLLINVKSTQMAKFMESSTPSRDLCSLFLFEKSSDMHLFVSEVRDKQQLVIHSALIPQRSSHDFQPPRPIEEIKKFGFKSYLRELIDAPEEILRYLCLYAAIHTIPIGSDQTQKNLSEILPHITDFQRVYTNSHCYTFNKSRYTGKVSSSSSEVSQSYWLTSSIDASQIEQLERRANQVNTELMKLNDEHEQLAFHKKEFEKKLLESRAELGKLREQKQYIENMQKKYQLIRKRLQTLQSENNNIFSDAENKAKFVVDMAKKRIKIFDEYIASAQQMLIHNKDKFMATYLEVQYQIEKRELESSLEDYFALKQDAVTRVETIEERIRQVKEEAKQALENASRVNEVNLERGVPDSLKAKFSELPETLEEIESEIHKCDAMSSVSHEVDERVIEDYKEREKIIERMQKDFSKKNQKLQNQRANYEELKNGWIEKVDNMINEINIKFMALFRQLKCAGEISLRKPDLSDDFGKYGVKIMVSYRSNEAIQELTAWQQSGGEKSVATMMYMIALQEMTRCPFRVVDEINQGMDPVNERKVFDIIVQNSCSKLFAQYFLLTPKLLPDLNFDERTNVICVYNGPKNLPHTKYSLNRFIELRKQINEKSRD